MQIKTSVICLFIVVALIANTTQILSQEMEQPAFDINYQAFTSHEPDNTQIPDSSFYQKKHKWAQIVDDFWGPGNPLAQKREIFNAYADRIEKKYPLFNGLNMDWDSLRTHYYKQITDSTSRGHFSAIMTHFGFEFGEMHTRIWDLLLATTPFNPGTPLFVLNTFEVTHFGASITTMPDSSLLVVNVLPDHPLNLEPGDIMLGYEGRPWKELTHELFESGIPLGGWLGSTDESITYMKLTNAGMNWHLFNSIDIIKYDSGDTLHLSLNPMASFAPKDKIFNNPQLTIDDVPLPSLNPSETFDGASFAKFMHNEMEIGYIYVTKHNYSGVNPEFGRAVNILMDTDALIIDLRWNTGGYQQLYDGLKWLFKEDFVPMKTLWRDNETDLFGLHTSDFPFWFQVKGDPDSYYDQPIAVLIGPNAQSFGDVFAKTVSHHPRVKFFGKATNGAFAGMLTDDAPKIDGWYVVAADFTQAENNSPYVSHARTPVYPDEEVWLNRDDVAKGEDTVVKSALEWIIVSDVNSQRQDASIPSQYSLQQNYPNPFNPETRFQFSIPNSQHVKIAIYNTLGQTIEKLVDQQTTAGNYEINFNAQNLPSGVYYYSIQAGDFKDVKKMIVIK